MALNHVTLTSQSGDDVPVAPCVIMQHLCSGMDNVTGSMVTDVTSNVTSSGVTGQWLDPWQVGVGTSLWHQNNGVHLSVIGW